jgi:hypothetical protein
VGQLEKARAAYERAAQSQEKIGSVWHAAKHLELCGAISKDLGQHEQMADFYRQAGSYFAQAGRISAGKRHFRVVKKMMNTNIECSFYADPACLQDRQ